MSQGKEYVVELLQAKCEGDSSSFNNQKQIYFEAMQTAKSKMLEIVRESDSQQIEAQIKEIENLDEKIAAVNDVLDDVKKILEYDIK